MKSMMIVALLLGTVAISCGGDSAPSPSATEPLTLTPTTVDSTPTPTTEASTPTIETAEIDMLLKNAQDYDGKIVEVQGAFWSDGTEQYLTDVLMESYPPQISKSSAILLIGELPSAVLDQLEHSEPPFGNVVWGSVAVTGRVQIDSETGQIVLEVDSIDAV